jgi:hypothetical protein
MDTKTQRQREAISADSARRDGDAALAAISAAISGTHVLALAGRYDASDLAGEAYAATLSGALVQDEDGTLRPIATIGDALSVALAALRPQRTAVGSVGVVYLSEDTDSEDGDTLGDTLADDADGWTGRDMSRRFADGARFAIAYADGWDTDGATYTSADGATLRGGDAIRAARSAALREATDGAHGSAAAARGAKNQAASAGRDAEVAAALREIGQPKGYAEAIARRLGWLTADSTPAERLDAMNRARVAVNRLKRRTSGEDSHSARD